MSTPTWRCSAAETSAWAGLHYFASRHGFHAPGNGATERAGKDAAGNEGVLTWPEGNGWLTQQLSAPIKAQGQLQTGTSVLRIAETRRGVEVDAFNHHSGHVERWQAPRCVVARSSEL